MTTIEPPFQSWSSRIRVVRRSKPFIAFVISYAVLVILCTAVVPVVPFTLSDRAGVPESEVPRWNAAFIAIYGVASLIVSPPLGYWADHHPSRKLPFLTGLLLLLSSLLLIWLSRTLPLQILARAVGGVASSIVYISGGALMVDAVGTAQIAEWMGWVSIALCVGSMVGPLLGGAVFATGGYHAVFAMLLGLVVLDAALRVVMVEPGRRRVEGRKEVRGDESEGEVVGGEGVRDPEAAVGAKGVNKEPTVHVAECGGAPTDTSTSTPHRANGPRIPAVFTLLASRRMLIAVWYAVVLAAIFSGFQAVLAIHVKDIWGWDSLGAGLIFLPLTLPSFLAPLIGQLSDRCGARWLMFAGFVSMCPLLVLMLFVTTNTLAQKAVLCVLLASIGFAINLVLDPLFGEYVAVVKDKEDEAEEPPTGAGAYAQAYALFNLAWALGNIGALLAGLLNERFGWVTMSWSLGLLSGLTALLAFIPTTKK